MFGGAVVDIKEPVFWWNLLSVHDKKKVCPPQHPLTCKDLLKRLQYDRLRMLRVTLNIWWVHMLFFLFLEYRPVSDRRTSSHLLGSSPTNQVTGIWWCPISPLSNVMATQFHPWRQNTRHKTWPEGNDFFFLYIRPI